MPGSVREPGTPRSIHVTHARPSASTSSPSSSAGSTRRSHDASSSDVGALVAVFRRLAPGRGGPDALGEGAHLVAAVVDVVLARDAVALRFEEARRPCRRGWRCVRWRRSPAPSGSRSRTRCRRARPSPPALVPSRGRRGGCPRAPPGRRAGAGAGSRSRGPRPRRRRRRRSRRAPRTSFSAIARGGLPGALGERHRHVRREVAVLGALGALERPKSSRRRRRRPARRATPSSRAQRRWRCGPVRQGSWGEADVLSTARRARCGPERRRHRRGAPPPSRPARRRTARGPRGRARSRLRRAPRLRARPRRTASARSRPSAAGAATPATPGWPRGSCPTLPMSKKGQLQANAWSIAPLFSAGMYASPTRQPRSGRLLRSSSPRTWMPRNSPP